MKMRDEWLSDTLEIVEYLFTDSNTKFFPSFTTFISVFRLYFYYISKYVLTSYYLFRAFKKICFFYKKYIFEYRLN